MAIRILFMVNGLIQVNGSNAMTPAPGRFVRFLISRQRPIPSQAAGVGYNVLCEMKIIIVRGMNPYRRAATVQPVIYIG